MKLSRLWWIGCAVLLPLFGLAAEGGVELLKNRFFQDALSQWETRDVPRENISIQDGVIQLDIKNQVRVFLTQSDLPLAQGDYTFAYEIRGESGKKFGGYVEWNLDTNGTVVYESSGAAARTVTENWQKIERKFSIPATKAANMTALYAAFYFDGPGKFQLRNISLTRTGGTLQQVRNPAGGPPSAALTELLQNGDFRKEFAFWETRNIPPENISVKNGVVSIDAKEKGNVFLTQSDLPLSQGNYTLTYEIRGESGKNFGGYVEWNLDVGGTVVYESSGAAARPVPEKWQKIERKFSISAAKAAEMTALYAAFYFVGPGKFQLRNVSLTRTGGAPRPEPPAPLAMFGGTWHFAGGSTIRPGSQPEMELINTSALKDVPVKAGQYYRLSFRTKGLISPDVTNYCIFQMLLAFNNNAPEQLPVPDDTNLGWLQNKSLEFQVPANSDKLDFKLTVKSGARITFDQFKLEEIPAPVDKGDLTLTEPVYRNRIYAANHCKAVAGTFRLPEGAKNAVVELRKGETLLDKVQVLADGSFTFAQVPAAGRYQVCAKFTDKDGKPEQNSLGLEVEPAGSNVMEVIMDADHNFRFNGKPFFPIAFWSTGLFSDVGYYYAARQGVNLIVFGGDDGTSDEASALEMLNMLDRYKMKVFFTTGMIRGSDEAARREFREYLERVFTDKVRNHPAFFGYFTSDEPIWRGEPMSKVTAMYEILCEFDPYHPVWINSAPCNTLKEHRVCAKASDIYGIDIYPVPTPSTHSELDDKELTCVGKYTDFCRQAVYGKRAVWMCMQGFSWHTVYQGEDGSGYPTREELRFMVYDSFLEGSSGATYWGPHHIKNQQFSDDLFAITRELRDRSALFSATEKLVPCQTDDPQLTAVQVTVDGVTMVVALNRSKAPLSAHISGKFPELTSIEDGKTKLISGGAVSLAGYEAAVFADGKMPSSVNELCPEIAELERKGNPYARRIARCISSRPTVPYAGDAQWIWDAQEFKPRGKSDLEKRFTLNEPVKAAVLHLAVDNLADAALNGQPADEFDAWNLMRSIDVGKLLVKGENVLKIHAENDFFLPCGLLVDLEITLSSGEVRHVISDAGWLDSDGNPVMVVARYGENDWGKRVVVEK